MATQPWPARAVRLLLDVHHSRHAAARLRELGHDVEAAADHPDLAKLDDAALLAVATADGRVVVTENVADFAPLGQVWSSAGRDHAGLVLTSPRRFHRGRASYPHDLVQALDALLRATPGDLVSQTWWL